DALRLAEHFAGEQKICVVLGDNIIEGDIRQAAQQFEKQERGARILLKEVPDPERFGVPVFEDGKIKRIEEKPRVPASPYAVTGIYFYDSTVFDRIRDLKPSVRQEYEITDVNNSYLLDAQLAHDVPEGWWTDAVTSEPLSRASTRLREQILSDAVTPS